MRELTPRLESTQRVCTLLSIAQLGYAHWFFGNLYEAVVRAPDRVAKDYDRPWLVSLAVSALSGVVATAWLVRTEVPVD
jgi:hypothetical protein